VYFLLSQPNSAALQVNGSRFCNILAEAERTVGLEAALKLETEGHLAHWQREAQSFLENRNLLELNIHET